MTVEKHPAEIALAQLRDFPEILEAQWAAEGRRWHVDFRQYSRPIIDEYFAAIGGKLCQPPNLPPTAEESREWEPRRELR
jgi:hypothetical protein